MDDTVAQKRPESSVGPLLHDWPDLYGSAVALSFDVDAETAVESMGQDLAHHPSLRSHQAYGPEVGVPRLLRLLAERSLRATFFIPGLTAERHPSTVELILGDGHEIAHHGYTHAAVAGSPIGLQREEIERGLLALETVGGVVPRGYRAPWWDLPADGGGLLREYGFTYDSSLFGADHPYSWHDEELIEIPVNWALDDWERYAFWPDLTGSGVIQSPSAVAADWIEEISAISAVGGVSVLTMHPFLSGRPSRVDGLATVLDALLDMGDVWVTTLDEIASFARERLIESESPEISRSAWQLRCSATR